MINSLSCPDPCDYFGPELHVNSEAAIRAPDLVFYLWDNLFAACALVHSLTTSRGRCKIRLRCKLRLAFSALPYAACKAFDIRHIAFWAYMSLLLHFLYFRDSVSDLFSVTGPEPASRSDFFCSSHKITSKLITSKS